MADDWNTVTIIGSRRNQAAGGGNKERQLNIARRQGAAIVTETKVGCRYCHHNYGRMPLLSLKLR